MLKKEINGLQLREIKSIFRVYVDFLLSISVAELFGLCIRRFIF